MGDETQSAGREGPDSIWRKGCEGRKGIRSATCANADRCRHGQQNPWRAHRPTAKQGVGSLQNNPLAAPYARYAHELQTIA